MEKYINQGLSEAVIEDLCERQVSRSEEAVTIATDILERVKASGDTAVRVATLDTDKVDIPVTRVSSDEIDEACERVNPGVREAFQQAADNIKRFHQAQLMGRRTVETMPGVTCFSEMRPIEKVGLYVPGGTTPLPSTALMLGIPARLAGCEEIVLTTPPNKDGTAADAVLYAANICGIANIHKIGGAQAVAAMAYGTEAVPKVNKVFGPGNKYVTAAKEIVSAEPQGAAIDMPAGPTEVCVIADEHADVSFVASDLLSQAEHGADSTAVLVCTSEEKTDEILEAVYRQLATLPRQEEAQGALGNSFALVVRTVDEAVEFSNRYAPEHLIVNTRGASNVVDKITNAGSVFLGPYSCESAGDYASGTNHCLPTYGYARVSGGVAVASFQKQITFQEITRAGAQRLEPIVSTMAAAESLEGHKRAMELRVSDTLSSDREV